MTPAARYAAAIDILDRIQAGEVAERAKRDGTNPGEADRLHLHSLVYRSRAKHIAEAIGMPPMRNPLTSILLWPLSSIACTITLIASGDPVVLGCGVGVVFLVYLLIYRRVALRSRFRRALFEQLAQRA